MTFSLRPGTYTTRNRGRKYIFQDSFGGRKNVIPAVQTFCAPQNLAACDVCEEIQIGDYWQHKSEEKIYCRPCMQLEYSKAVDRSNTKCPKAKTLQELNSFKVIIIV